MKEIKLTKGKVALVDDEDYEYLNQWRWSVHLVNKKYLYAERYENHKTIPMHNQIMKTEKGFVVDHINHNGLDNQKENLRNCTVKQNFLNRRPSSATGFLGVYKNGDKYIAQKYNGTKVINLGRFDSPKEAALAYDIEAKKLYGEFANLNFK